MPHLPHLETAWRSYREDVLPNDAPSNQQIECRRAFYAGAQSLFEAIMMNLGPGEEPTEAEIAMMDEVHEELQQFARDVLAGKA